MKSRESAKAELLEKLTGTEIYSRISREIYARSKAADEAMNLLKNTISLIELIPEEELLSLRKEQGAPYRTSFYRNKTPYGTECPT